MKQVALRTSLIVVTSSAILLGYDHYTVTSAWRKNHPLIKYCLDKVIQTPRIQSALGPPLTKSDTVTGIFTADKPWANLALEVKGTKGKAKVTLMADGKESSEPGEDLLNFDYKREFSYFEQVVAFIQKKELKSENLSWKIISMHAKINDITTFPIIVQGKLVNQEQEAVEVAPDSDSAKSNKPNPNKPTQDEIASARRLKQYEIAGDRWKIIFVVVAGCFITLQFIRHFTVIHPIGRTNFVLQAVDDIKANLKVKEELGLPLKVIDSARGYLNYNKRRGYANILVKGQKGFGRLLLAGHYNTSNKRWVYTQQEIIQGQNSSSLL